MEDIIYASIILKNGEIVLCVYNANDRYSIKQSWLSGELVSFTDIDIIPTEIAAINWNVKLEKQ